MTENPTNQNDVKTIYVNKKKFYVKEDTLAGKEVLELAGFDVNKYDLFLVQGQKSEQIPDAQSVEIKNDQRFNAILKSVPFG